jgi:hypothetical protein
MQEPEAVGQFSYDIISKYFEYPLIEAASILGVSDTYLKRLCRNFAIDKWPYRKIASLRRKLDKINSKRRKTPEDAEKLETIKRKLDYTMKNGLLMEGLTRDTSKIIKKRNKKKCKVGETKCTKKINILIEEDSIESVESVESDDMDEYLPESPLGFHLKLDVCYVVDCINLYEKVLM